MDSLSYNSIAAIIGYIGAAVAVLALVVSAWLAINTLKVFRQNRQHEIRSIKDNKKKELFETFENLNKYVKTIEVKYGEGKTLDFNGAIKIINDSVRNGYETVNDDKRKAAAELAADLYGNFLFLFSSSDSVLYETTKVFVKDKNGKDTKEVKYATENYKVNIDLKPKHIRGGILSRFLQSEDIADEKILSWEPVNWYITRLFTSVQVIRDLGIYVQAKGDKEVARAIAAGRANMFEDIEDVYPHNDGIVRDYEAARLNVAVRDFTELTSIFGHIMSSTKWTLENGGKLERTDEKITVDENGWNRWMFEIQVSNNNRFALEYREFERTWPQKDSYLDYIEFLLALAKLNKKFDKLIEEKDVVMLNRMEFLTMIEGNKILGETTKNKINLLEEKSEEELRIEYREIVQGMLSKDDIAQFRNDSKQKTDFIEKIVSKIVAAINEKMETQKVILESLEPAEKAEFDKKSFKNKNIKFNEYLAKLRLQKALDKLDKDELDHYESLDDADKDDYIDVVIASESRDKKIRTQYEESKKGKELIRWKKLSKKAQEADFQKWFEEVFGDSID